MVEKTECAIWALPEQVVMLSASVVLRGGPTIDRALANYDQNITMSRKIIDGKGKKNKIKIRRTGPLRILLSIFPFVRKDK